MQGCDSRCVAVGFARAARGACTRTRADWRPGGGAPKTQRGQRPRGSLAPACMWRARTWRSPRGRGHVRRRAFTAGRACTPSSTSARHLHADQSQSRPCSCTRQTSLYRLRDWEYSMSTSCQKDREKETCRHTPRHAMQILCAVFSQSHQISSTQKL
jgi:hypothetical protein